MRHLAIAGSILLASMLGIAPAAQARGHHHRAIHGRGLARPSPRRSAMADVVLAAARRNGVPGQLALGVASVESGFNPRARSRSGAVGLMQVLPSTARGLGCRGSLSSPVANAECGTRYLAAILGDRGGNVRLAAAMYTQGRYARRMSRVGARYAALVLRHTKRLPV